MGNTLFNLISKEEFIIELKKIINRLFDLYLRNFGSGFGLKKIEVPICLATTDSEECIASKKEDELKNDNEKLRNEINDFKEMFNENSKKVNENDAVSSTNTKTESKLLSLKTVLKEKLNEIDELKNRNNTLQLALNEFEIKNTKLNEEETNEIQNENKRISEQLEDLLAKNSSLRTEKFEIIEKFQNLKAKHESESNDFKDEISKLLNEKFNLKTSLDNSSRLVSFLKANNAKSDEEDLRSLNMINLKNSTISMLEKERDQLIKDKSIFHEELEKTKLINVSLAKEIDELKNFKNFSEINKDEIANSILSLQDEKNKFQLENDEVKKKSIYVSESKEAEIENISKANTRLTKEIGEIKESKARYEYFRQQLEDLI